MSGGVDSSVAAGLLVARGYDVVGATMQIWQESQTDPRHSGCCSLGAVEDARRVANRLGIPYYVLNLKEEFKKTVIDDFVSEYSQGRTPNPCIQCNRFVKFSLFLQKAAEIGCDMIATGHYARVRKDREGVFRLMQARAVEKDQSYALYMLSQAELSKVMFPLGRLSHKDETRTMARRLGLSVANKPDSQEICFVSEAGGYVEFLKKHAPDSMVAGDIVNSNGERLGTHDGVAQYTIGQRKRIRLNVEGKPLFVLNLDPTNQRIVVGSNDELLTRSVRFENVVEGPALRGKKVFGRIRYNMPLRPASLEKTSPAVAVFDEPVRAVTPGQTAVFYQGRTVVAGGQILRAGQGA